MCLSPEVKWKSSVAFGTNPGWREYKDDFGVLWFPLPIVSQRHHPDGSFPCSKKYF